MHLYITMHITTAIFTMSITLLQKYLSDLFGLFIVCWKQFVNTFTLLSFYFIFSSWGVRRRITSQYTFFVVVVKSYYSNPLKKFVGSCWLLTVQVTPIIHAKQVCFKCEPQSLICICMAEFNHCMSAENKLVNKVRLHLYYYYVVYLYYLTILNSFWLS